MIARNSLASMFIDFPLWHCMIACHFPQTVKFSTINLSRYSEHTINNRHNYKSKHQKNST